MLVKTPKILLVVNTLIKKHRAAAKPFSSHEKYKAATLFSSHEKHKAVTLFSSHESKNQNNCSLKKCINMVSLKIVLSKIYSITFVF